MFRPAREHSRFGYVPLRLVASVFSLFALLLAVAVLVGMQYERQRVASSGAVTGPKVGPTSLVSLLAPGDLLKVLVALLFLAAVGILFFTTFQNYRVLSGDDGQLSQVFLNLVINALQAMPSGGTLFLATRRSVGWAEIAVRDSGEGIQREILPHVFDPYFTTRPRGVGLGLAIAHRIVEGHHGTIDVESEVGKGTTMIVRLPLADHVAIREPR